MTARLWEEAWFDACDHAQRDLWRGVEAQHRVATMRIVDNLQDQEILERILEDNKPPLPPGVGQVHYLLSTPFRYVSPWPSRFRLPDQPGAWYGAEEPETVAAEVAYWRWRFFMDSDGLREEQLLTEHTFFQARFAGRELDLTAAPWNEHRDGWRHLDDYSECQDLAGRVREVRPPIAGIRYESARREGGICGVVFEAMALGLPEPQVQQTWVSKTTKELVLFAHERGVVEFRMG